MNLFSKCTAGASQDVLLEQVSSKFTSTIRHTVFTKESFDPLVHKPKDLTSEQKDVLRRSWAVFSSGPDRFKPVTCAFIRFVGEDGSPHKLLKSAVMRNHATSIMDFLQEAIQNLDQPEVIQTMAFDLGTRHLMYGARITFVKALCEGFLFSLEKTCWPNVDAEVMVAWEALLLIIAHHLSKGFHKRMKDFTSVEVGSELADSSSCLADEDQDSAKCQTD